MSSIQLEPTKFESLISHIAGLCWVFLSDTCSSVYFVAAKRQEIGGSGRNRS